MQVASLAFAVSIISGIAAAAGFTLHQRRGLGAAVSTSVIALVVDIAALAFTSVAAAIVASSIVAAIIGVFVQATSEDTSREFQASRRLGMWIVAVGGPAGIAWLTAL